MPKPLAPLTPACLHEPFTHVVSLGRFRAPPRPTTIRVLPSDLDMREEASKWVSTIRPPAVEAPIPPRIARKASLDRVDGGAPSKPAKPPGSKRDGYQVVDVLAAIDASDTETLEAIRGRNIRLFVSAGGSGLLTPLLYAMNTGNALMTTAVLGVLSRWVNHAAPDTLGASEDKAILQEVRGTLRMGIRFALKHDIKEALASCLQILVMSEGVDWLREAAEKIAVHITAGHTEVALQEAQAAVQRFISRSLSEQQVASVEDFRLNAITDLVMMGCAQALRVPIGPHCFGRDRRVLTELHESIQRAKLRNPDAPATRALRVSEFVAEVMGASHLGYEAKVQSLRNRAL